MRKSKKIPIGVGSKIIFICYANLCRSPMAEALAKKILGDKVHIESAGISSSEESSLEEAIEFMQKAYDIDISVHRSRNIKDLDMDHYDYVFVLDLNVYYILKYNYKIPADKLVLWEIQDPCVHGIKKINKSAKKIYKLIKSSISVG